MMSETMEVLSKRSTREKLLNYLSGQSQRAGSLTFSIPFNRQELADYLCVDRSAMSSELSKLQKEGLLSCERSSFTLHKELDLM
jgi:CRP-like cAMP-binding protein